MSIPVFATHNPSVSHPASSITNSTFLDNYSANGTWNFTNNVTFGPSILINPINKWAGIGTMNPTEALEIASGGNPSLRLTPGSIYSQIYSKATSTSTADLYISNMNTGKTYFRTAPTYDDPTIRMTIDNAGNVGIGTAAPYRTLQVNGTFQTNESVYLATGPGSGLVGINNTAPNATLHVMGIGTAGGLRVTNQSNAYEAFFVNSTLGAVGIGTTNPETMLNIWKATAGSVSPASNTLLTVENNNDAYISILTPNANTAGIMFGSPDGNSRGFVRYHGSSDTSLPDTLEFQTGNAAALRLSYPSGIVAAFQAATNITTASGDLMLNPAGRVGINNSAPNATLHVMGRGPEGGFRVTNQSNSYEAFFVNSTLGMVGIGTAGPGNLLQIQTTSGSGAITELLSLRNNDGADNTASGIVFDVGGDFAYAGIVGGAATWASDYGYLAFYTRNTGQYPTAASSERMRIDRSGNVGIGTTAPFAKLMVNGTTPALQVNDSAYFAVSGGLVGIGTASPASTLQVTGTANVLALNVNNTLYVNTTTSNVGIGITAPTKTLDVYGSANIGVLTGIAGTSLTVNQPASGGMDTLLYLKSKGNSVAGRGTAISFSAPNTDSGGAFENARIEAINEDTGNPAKVGFGFQTHSGTALAERVRITGTGNVGINNINPSQTLTINGTANISNTGSGDSFRVDDALGDTTPFVIDASGNVGIGTSAPYRRLQVNGTGGVSLETNESVYLAIGTGGQKVGINTTSPTQALTVMGDANVTGTLYVGSQSFSTIDATGNLNIGGSGNVTGNMTVDSGTLRVKTAQPSFFGIDDGLLMYLPFSERTGPIAYDRSPFGNNGVLTNMNITGNSTSGWNSTDCVSGGCMKIDDANDYVDVTNIESNASLNNNKTGTLMAWFKFNRDTPDGSGIGRCAGSCGAWVDMRYVLNFVSGKVRFIVGDGQNVQNTFTSNGAFDNTTWYHVAATHDGVNLKIYINGALDNSVAQAYEPNVTGLPFRIGWIQSLGNPYLNATIDEVRIYNRSLSAQEIMTYYLNTVQGTLKPYTSRTGNTGINTSYPNATLHVLGGGTGGGFRVTNASNAAEVFFVNSTLGAVGIRTTGPSTTLDVAGTGRFTDRLGIASVDTSAMLSLQPSTSITATAGQYGIIIDLLLSSAATSSGVGINSRVKSNSAITTTNTYAYAAATPSLSGSAAFTNNYGVFIQNQGATGVTNAAGLYVESISGASSTNYAAIFAGGNVGIGTTGPTQLLQVQGATGIALVNDTDAGGQVIVNAHSATSNQSSINFTNRLNNIWSIGTDWANAGDNGLSFVSRVGGANTRLYINDSSGNVGIGTTNPSTKLHIQSSVSNSEARFENTGTTASLLRLIAGPSASYQWTINAYGQDNAGFVGYFTIQDAIADKHRLTITNNGNVGINNLNPSQTLTVNGTFNVTNTGSGDSFRVDDALGDTTPFVIDASGNVGIGTTAPYRTLQVNGTLQTNESVYLATGPGSGLVGINNTAPNATLHVMGIGTAGGLRVTNQSNAAEVFFVNSTLGRVGIGTASMTGILQVQTTSDGNVPEMLTIKNAGTTDGTGGQLLFRAGTFGVVKITGSAVDISQPSGLLQIEVADTSGNFKERMRINQLGNVGIGTAAPYRTLQVNGTLQTNESVYLATGAGSGLVGINNTAPNATLHVMGIGTAGGLRVTNQSNGAEVFFVNSTLGAVGIGTTGPTQKFQIGDAGVSASFVGMHIVTGDGGFYFGTDDNKVLFDAGRNGGYDLTIDGNNNGNVGIGTTVPRDRLHVEGNMTVNASAAGVVPLTVAGMVTQTANLTEWFNGTADIKNNKILAINSTGAMCFGSGCSGQIFFNGTAMIIRVV